MKNIYFILIAYFGIGMHAQSIRSFVDTTSIAIGAPAHLYIQVQKDKDYDTFGFKKYVLQDSISKNLEILSVDYDTIMVNQSPTYQMSIGFTAWEKGQYEVEPQPIYLEEDTIYTKPFSVQVTEPKEPEDIHDIKDIVYVGRPWWQKALDWWPVALAIVVIGAIIYLIVKRRRNREKQADIQPVSHETLNDITIKKLKELQKRELIQNGKVKQFYTEYSNILKDYLGKRFYLPAKELFTSDLLYKLENKHSLKDESLRSLKTVLRRADLAKFAKIIPSAEQGAEDIQSAINIINSIPTESLIQNDGE